MKSLYELANEEIRACISDYLEMAKTTNALTNILPQHLNTFRKRVILLKGLDLDNFNLTPEEVVTEWQRRLAVPFDLETGITYGVYTNIRQSGTSYLDEIEQQTEGFKNFPEDFIKENPHFLPIFQHLSGIFSKAALKKLIGSSVSDKVISKKSAVKLAQLLKAKVDPNSVNKGEILQRLESTLEGIVRDLVGRVLLESIVNSALNEKGITFKRENDYSSLSGVIYNFRADFVIPDEISPLAFIEVRKSSSRHASLYAKEKMFSAINWKGKHKEILGILCVDGEWTSETLRIMANIFDYVIPISRIIDLTNILSEYIAGDKTKLKWLVEFSIKAAN